MTVNGWGNALADLLVDLWVPLHLLELLLVLLSDVWHSESHGVWRSIWVHARLEAKDLDVASLHMLFDLLVGAGVGSGVALGDAQDTHDLDPVSRSALVSQVSVNSEQH